MQRVYREVHRIAELRGWGHSKSADVRDVVERLKDELGDLHRVFSKVRHFGTYWYPKPPEYHREDLAEADALREALEGLTRWEAANVQQQASSLSRGIGSWSARRRTSRGMHCRRVGARRIEPRDEA